MNKYDLNEMAVKQLELDTHIKDKIEIDDYQYWSYRIIALNVELNEFVNELRFFKYWSKKPASEKEVVIDELVDCIHFALSMTNTLGVKDLVFGMDDMKRPIQHIYLEIGRKLIEVHCSRDADLMKEIVGNIMEMAWSLGYTMEDIQEAYDKKNKVNYERQNTGY